MTEDIKNDRDFMDEPVVLPIEDILDLHTFRPKDIPALLEDYLQACIHAHIYSIRIIHGKGKGVLKNLVHNLLKKNPMVESFKKAPYEAGSWGATVVQLKQKDVI